ncbi:MAG: YdeI/OmpD-associated family protein [Bacteroidota bacterium]
MHYFKATLAIIVGNPYVLLPPEVLQAMFEAAQKNKGPIPVRGTINGKPYQQTLVKYSGAWRLYINMQMLKDSPRRIGEEIEVGITYDPSDRSIAMHPKLAQAFEENPEAKAVFDGLTPSRQKEILRYIAHLKTEASVDRNVERAIGFLQGKDRFVGRDKP